MKTYTIFCRESNNIGTTHIDSVQAESVEQAKELGIAQCCEDWNDGFEKDEPAYSSKNVTCIGVAAGNTPIVFWEDLCDS